ncbi:hypothetical protein MPRI_51310 [Mycobacterium paraintracellulare]|uniref:Uncharacterized protein n=1 Tax=Mycobacterium paraintracellulare TaxID=1138383 RepID=A0ABM7KF82_9MYCO|nr:hypothetical protein MPRI_51310 [Mycobacterium paraintracellulare]BCO42289.1 hypothetical protein MINTM001_34280 [Mycobacterium paraintracellulare]BCP10947.1 hypothetical protein MINTM020_30450 [Mycobacterium paraintracellulare]
MRHESQLRGAKGHTEAGAPQNDAADSGGVDMATRVSLSQTRSCGPNVAWRLSSRSIRDPSGKVASRAAPLVGWMWLVNSPNWVV